MTKQERADAGLLLTIAIWPALSPDEVHGMRKQYAPLLDHFRQHLASIEENPEFFAVRATDGIARLIGLLQSINTPVAKDAVVAAAVTDLKLGQASQAKILRSIDMAASMWTTTMLSSLDFPRPGLLIWGGEALNDLFKTSFTEQCCISLPKDQYDKESFQSSDKALDFTAASLVANHGFTLCWTSNLAAHLNIDWQHKILTVYEHKIALYNHLRFPSPNSPLPSALLAEALDTINLLFPFQHDPTKRLLARHSKPFYGLGWCGRSATLSLDDFRIWRTRIDELAQASRQPPVGVQQLRLARDRRNLLSFATFWMACGVGVLTVAGLVFAVVAAVYGAMQYRLALDQYRLSVAQACMDPAARVALAEWCGGG
jgi:hypothetical protein